MRRLSWLVLSALLCATLIGCSGGGKPSDSNKKDEVVVTELVEAFGKELKNVSLLAPSEDVLESMKEHYGPYVAPGLIEEWAQDPENAPGRLVSSPWPERIEVLSVHKSSEDHCEVLADIIEVTSADAQGEPALTRPIILVVEKTDGKWLIEEAELGEYIDESPEEETKTDSGTYVGQADSNFIEIKISGVPEDQAHKVFMLSEELKAQFEGLALETGTNVRFDYYENENGQNVIVSIEKI